MTDKLFKPFLESLYDSDPTTIGAILEGYNTIFEGFEYVRDSKKFANNIFNALMDVTEDDFMRGYVGEDTQLNKQLRINGPIVSLGTDGIISNTPSHTPLLVLFSNGQKTGPNRDVEAAMLPDVNRPVLIFFRGNPIGLPPERLYRLFKKQVEINQDNINHELVHLFDRMAYGKTAQRNKYSSRKSEQLHRTISKENDDYLSDPEVAKNVTPEIIQYMNSPTEVNARLVAAIESAISEGNISSWDDFYNHVMNHVQIKKKEGMKHSNPTKFSDENYKKIIRNLHKVYSNIMEL